MKMMLSQQEFLLCEKMTSSTPRRERTIYNFTRKDNNVVMVARFIILAVLFLMNVFKLTNG